MTPVTDPSRTVLFRVDGGRDIGTGHVARCLTLATALDGLGLQSVFMIKKRPGSEPLVERIRRQGHRVVEFQPGAGHDEGRAIVEKAASIEARLVVVDHYEIGLPQEQHVRSEGFTCLSIDDIGRPHDADLILDQNIDAVPEKYPGLTSRHLLLGPRFALVRAVFLRARRRRGKVAGPGSKVLVTLGGADLGGFGPLLAEALCVEGIEVTLVQGPSAREIRMPGVRTIQNQTPEEMANWMLWADLAIGAGGTTCWELTCVGTPFMVTVLADNQLMNASGLASAGIAINLGRAESLNYSEVASQAARLLSDPVRRQAMASAGMALVDGLGTERVIEAIADRLHTRWDAAAHSGSLGRRG